MTALVKTEEVPVEITDAMRDLARKSGALAAAAGVPEGLCPYRKLPELTALWVSAHKIALGNAPAA